MTEKAGAESGRGREAITVWLLGLTQVIGFGTLYYSFALIEADVSREFGWSSSWFYGFFSTALVAGGLVAPLAGRAFDRFGAARLMVLGSGLCALTLAAMAAAPGPGVFIAGMIMAQVVNVLALYDAAFTSLVQFEPKNGSRRIVYLTLIAGFASSVFWPVTSWLDEAFGWRATMAIYAGLNLLVCVPAHGLIWRWTRAASAKRQETGADEAPAQEPSHPVDADMKRRVFILIVAGFALSGFALSAVLAQMVPMLEALGFGAASLGVAVLFGPAQVVVRFTNLVFGARAGHPLFVTIFAMSLLPVAFVIAAAGAPAFASALVFVVLVGMCSGLKSIVQGTLPLAVFGPQGYGARLGIMASARYVLGALAPFAFAWLHETTDVRIAALIFAAIGALGVCCFLAVARMIGRRA